MLMVETVVRAPAPSRQERAGQLDACPEQLPKELGYSTPRVTLADERYSY